jgi:hypothetical protein
MCTIFHLYILVWHVKIILFFIVSWWTLWWSSSASNVPKLFTSTASLPGNKQTITVYAYMYIYIYVWKLNQTVLELVLELSNFCSSLDGIWTHTILTLQHHSLSLTSSALDHSTTSTPYIYIWWNTAITYIICMNLKRKKEINIMLSPQNENLNLLIRIKFLNLFLYVSK